MDEDAQLGVGEPLRIAPLVDRFPSGFNLGVEEVAEEQRCDEIEGFLCFHNLQR